MGAMTDLTASLIPDFDLASRNTLALQARSRFGFVLEDADQLPALFDYASSEALAVRLLGGGSNVVLAPGFDGITALIASRGRRIVDETATHTLVEAAAGENWHDLVAWTVEQGLGGLENLALIPGTTGAAPVQNIGAYGSELADSFHSLDAFDRRTGKMTVFGLQACAFAYRDSVFKHEPDRYVVTKIRLALPKAWRPNLGFAGLAELSGAGDLSPRVVMERVIALRTSKLPDWRVTPNAGSFFHNPVVAADIAAQILEEDTSAPSYPQADGRTKLSAGWLIEKSGLKGYRMGPVGVSERHALVLVNYGGAQQSHIAALASHIRQTVQSRFGIILTPEPIFC